MKLKHRLLLMMLLCGVSVVTFTACSDEDNTPLTTTDLAGKRYYSDKLYDPYYDRWIQKEIRFTSDNKVYCTKIHEDFMTGKIEKSSPVEYEYVIDYPNLTIRGEKTFFASFVDNNTIVFEGDTSLRQIYKSASSTNKFEGLVFSTNPQTETGPYLGQRFNASSTDRLWLGGKFAHVYCEGTGSFIINYPNFIIYPYFNSSKETRGYFVDENTIILTKYCGSDCSSPMTFHRIR